MFVAHMSHELRTPLNAIIGFTDLLRLRLKTLEGHDKLVGYADDVSSAGHHLLQLINDILDLTKIEAGKCELSEEKVDLVSILDSCTRMLRGQADEHGIAFVCQAAPSLPQLRIDKLKLKQIVINLISNAIKFTPQGGTVTLTAAIEATGWLAIVVADTGIGIEAQDIEKVFSPFSQLNASLSRKTPGTGLGLPLTKALVELHGGRITLESERRKGTVVTTRFPPYRILGEAVPQCNSMT
jgi:signal transduction histidine kinase